MFGVFYLCVENAELCYTFLFKFFFVVKSRTAPKKHLLSLSLFSFLWETETCPHLGSNPLGEKGMHEEMGNGKCSAFPLYSTCHNTDQASVIGMVGIRGIPKVRVSMVVFEVLKPKLPD